MRIAAVCLLVFTFFLTACKKGNLTKFTVPPDFSFTATINGSAFQADSSLAFLDIYGDTRILGMIAFDLSAAITCYMGDSSTSTTMNNVSYPYSTVMPGSLFGYANDYHSTIPQGYDAISGNLYILSCDSVTHKISGSFNATLVDGVAHDTVTITNGAFSNLHFALRYH